MVSVDEAIVVRYEKLGKRFEVLADPEAVLKLREGEPVDIRNALAVFEIFKDARKAEKAAETDIEKIFGTTDVEQVAKEIMLHGEFHPTTEQKRRMLESIKKQIVEIIARNAVDPRTNLPHPRDRIARAMEEARVKIDLQPAILQVEKVVKALRPILPLKFGKVKLDVFIPMEYTNAYGKIKGVAKILREDWLSDGVRLRIEVPAGMKVEIIDMLNDLTKGNVDVKEVEESG